MTKSLVFISFVLLGFSPVFAADNAVPPASARQYPGGADEQDLKVQPELVNPTAKIDRRTMDQKVLQNFLHKNGQSTDAPAATTPSKQKAAKPKPKPKAKK